MQRSQGQISNPTRGFSLMTEIVSPLGVIGATEDPYSGRAWVRTFPNGQYEVLYRSAKAPSELEQLNAWMTEAGIGRVSFDKRPGWSEIKPESIDPETGEVRVHEVDPETNADRSRRRAKQRVRWLAKAIDADHMLTLTYRENMCDRAVAKKHFQKFIRACRIEWPTFQYVAAAEPQKRGAIHWHVGVHGFVNYDKLRGFWWRAMGHRVDFSDEGKPVLRNITETPGNVQGVKSNQGGKRSDRWSPDRLAAYIGKYVAKEVGFDGADGAGYSASRGVTWNVQRYAVKALTFEGVATCVLSLSASPTPFVWQSQDRSVLWLCGSAASRESGSLLAPSS